MKKTSTKMTGPALQRERGKEQALCAKKSWLIETRWGKGLGKVTAYRCHSEV